MMLLLIAVSRLYKGAIQLLVKTDTSHSFARRNFFQAEITAIKLKREKCQ